MRVTSQPIDPQAARLALPDPAAGACVTFEGWVRNHHEGRAVQALEYEALVPLAEKEGRRILAEARARWPGLQAAAEHRTGRLAIGDLAVWVGVTAPHRGAAFAACAWIMEEIKARVPIWKKEYYADGSSGWILPGGL